MFQFKESQRVHWDNCHRSPVYIVYGGMWRKQSTSKRDITNVSAGEEYNVHRDERGLLSCPCACRRMFESGRNLAEHLIGNEQEKEEVWRETGGSEISNEG